MSLQTLDMEEWHMTTHSSRALVNYPKNRYINIVPCEWCGVCPTQSAERSVCCNTGACELAHSAHLADDHSRVVLDLLGELPGSDYINATWVNVSERLLWA